MFFLRNVLDRQLDNAQVDALRVTFEGFDTRAGVEPTLGALGPIGAMSASPFEAEGCMHHAYFVREELREMGLGAAPTSLDFDLREADSRVTTRIVLNTPGVSRAQYDREETLAKPTSLLQLRQTRDLHACPNAGTSATRASCARAMRSARSRTASTRPPSSRATWPRCSACSKRVACVRRCRHRRAVYADFAAKGGQFAFGGTLRHAAAQQRTHGRAPQRQRVAAPAGASSNTAAAATPCSGAARRRARWTPAAARRSPR